MVTEDTRFKDDWNMNASFLEYCTQLLIRMGCYAANHAPTGWCDTSKELYRLVGGLIEPKIAKELKDKFIEVDNLLNMQDIIPGSTEGDFLIKRRINEALQTLDQIQIDLVGGMHKARLILPKSDNRQGLKQMRKEWGIEDDNLGENPGQ